MDKRTGAASPACARRYSETEWVDCLLGHLDPLQTRDMTAHLTVCPACRGVRDEWQALLGMEPDRLGGIQAAGGGTAAGAAARAADAVGASAGIPQSAYPSERIRRSLRQAVVRRSKLRRLLRPAAWASAGAAAAAVMLLLSGAYRPDVSPASGGRYVEMREPRAAALLHAPETAAYRVDASAAQLGGGYVWLNGPREEAVLLLDNLPASDRFDYRAWAWTGDEYVDMGLLQLDEGRAHLYVKGPYLRSPSNIAVSAEPKGVRGATGTGGASFVVILHR